MRINKLSIIDAFSIQYLINYFSIELIFEITVPTTVLTKYYKSFKSSSNVIYKLGTHNEFCEMHIPVSFITVRFCVGFSQILLRLICIDTILNNVTKSRLVHYYW